MTEVLHNSGAGPDPRRNKRVGLVALGFVGAMVGLAYASVPLYQLFCQVTGYGGTTQVATDSPKGVIDRMMTVRFDSTVANDLAWTVKPAGAKRSLRTLFKGSLAWPT